MKNSGSSVRSHINMCACIQLIDFFIAVLAKLYIITIFICNFVICHYRFCSDFYGQIAGKRKSR